MNSLRVLKKLSKRAAPLLPLLGDDRQQFRAARGDSYTGLVVKGRKHADRWHSSNDERVFAEHIQPAKNGRGFVKMRHPPHPLKGTMMVGATTGYYEPEWDEETAWEALQERVWWTLTGWTDEGEPIKPTHLRTPSDYFKAAAAMVATNAKPN